jgi:arylsulfatase A-like enzyme
MRQAYQVATGPFPVADFSATDWRKQRWGYYRMIEKVDAEIGKVLAALHDAGLENNTLVVFTSDHGECAGAHGFNQKTVLYEESARVPLIVSFPGKIKQGAADPLVNTGIDLLPTMLDFAGLEIPKQFPGRSLRSLASGQPVADWREYVVVENDLDQAGIIDGVKPRMSGRMVRTERYKYCVYSHGNQRESLVDLQTDPGEMVNLATDPAHRKTLLQHRALLTQFGEEHHDPLIAELLADDVKPIPFDAAATQVKSRKNQP